MIDKIDSLGSARPAQPVKRAAKTGTASATTFARQMDDTSESSASANVSGANSVNGILGVQEVDDALAHASKGKQRAIDILDRLEDLRLDLLAGGLSREKLLQLGRLVAARRGQISDPKLNAILDDIDLRAQVELAKYGP